MAEDLTANLRNYQIQLRQVDAALLSDANNEDLLKLKEDLQQVIDLTKDLMGAESGGSHDAEESEALNQQPKYHIKTGDMVLAPWSEDGQFYEARVEDVTSDGQCTVIFSSVGKGRKVPEVCLLSLLKPLVKRKHKLPADRPAASVSSASASSSSSPFIVGSSTVPQNRNDTDSKRPKLEKDRQTVKKKQQKWEEKRKTQEEEREKEKSKWQQFHSKVSSKHLKGSTKKSIFASPDTVEGKVGVGTCGIGGRGMTDLPEAAQSTQWKKEKASTSQSRPYLPKD